MENAIRKIVTIGFFATLLLAVSSCEKVFHNDKLDFMWRLDSVSYSGLAPFDGIPVQTEAKKSIYFSFARDLVEVNNYAWSFGPIGVLADYGDSLKLDFSMVTGTEDMLVNLRRCGIPELCVVFRINRLDSKKMTLECPESVLYFTKW